VGFQFDDRPTPSLKTESVYLKSKGGHFEVRISDHDPQRGTRRPAGQTVRYNFDASQATPKSVNELLTRIVTNHRP
jgi:hypothetical protein